MHDAGRAGLFARFAAAGFIPPGRRCRCCIPRACQAWHGHCTLSSPPFISSQRQVRAASWWPWGKPKVRGQADAKEERVLTGHLGACTWKGASRRRRKNCHDGRPPASRLQTAYGRQLGVHAMSGPTFNGPLLLA